MTSSLNRSRALAAAKLLFGAALIAVLISTVDLGVLIERFRAIDIVYLIAVLTLPHIAMLLSTIKWQMLLSVLNVRARLFRLFNLYMIGTFFSNFLPTMVGGDVYKSYALSRETGDAASVLAATFLERLMGLTAMVSLLPLVLIQEPILNAIPMLNLLVIGATAFYLLLLIVIFSPVLDLFRDLRPSNRIAGKVWSFAKKTHNNVQQFRKFKGALLSAYLISLVFYVVTVATTWSAAKSLGVTMDFVYLAAIVPIVLLAAIVPVSLNGLGVTEAGYVLFFQLAGVPLEDALGIALLLRARLIFSALIGGLIFLWHRTNISVPDKSDTLDVNGELARNSDRHV